MHSYLESCKQTCRSHLAFHPCLVLPDTHMLGISRSGPQDSAPPVDRPSYASISLRYPYHSLHSLLCSYIYMLSMLEHFWWKYRRKIMVEELDWLQNRAMGVRLATSLWYGTLMKNCFKDWSQSSLWVHCTKYSWNLAPPFVGRAYTLH